MNTPISEQLGQQLTQAIMALRKVNESKLVTKENEAIRKGTTEFLQKVLLEHADELVACWNAVHFEYEPFLEAQNVVLRRVAAMNHMRQQVAEAQAAPQQQEVTAAPENVVELKQP